MAGPEGRSHGAGFDRAGDGTRLRYWAQMGPGPSGLTPLIEQMPDKEDRIIARRLQEWETNMTATITGIKHVAEETA